MPDTVTVAAVLSTYRERAPHPVPTDSVACVWSERSADDPNRSGLGLSDLSVTAKEN